MVVWPWRRDIVVIVTAKRTEDRGFESRQVVKFLRFCNAVLCKLNVRI
jgi:hypothetical protein